MPCSSNATERTPLLPRFTAQHHDYTTTPSSLAKNTPLATVPRALFRHVTLTLLVLFLFAVFQVLSQLLSSILDSRIFSIPITANSAEPDNSWSPGNAFSSILMLQLSCLFQPAGSSIIADVTNAWRLNPLLVACDTLRTLYNFAKLCFRYRCSPTSASLAICAARRMAFHSDDYPAYSIEAIHETSRRRPVLASIIALVSVLQFAKVVAVKGSPSTMAASYCLASVYFSSWLLQETLLMLVRVWPRDLFAWQQEKIETMCEDVGVGPGYSILQATYLSSICLSISTIALTIFDLGDWRNPGRLPPWAHILLCIWLVFIPPLMIFLDLCFGCFGHNESSGRRFLTNVCHTVIGFQIYTLVLLYFTSFYQSRETRKPQWTDWLGKF
ncbi:hypothetical protein K402DRAFT_392798 [Aulographum hederae CBS 113979]|uniref:Uncharacterized protein n=1 Tax=Aulographum hederae CBS 113979 TaxID=1176131 RepID=A0A6G1H393_9PEZI|nr:hypothetical protein K402DRAFT_392798 [Aulographum hederae CBS 113979]